MSSALSKARLRWRQSPERQGLTLVEMLVAMALTLMIVFAIVTMFQWVGERVTQARAILESAGRLRAAAALLQSDLDGHTANTVALMINADNGYFEYIEGAGNDSQGIKVSAAAALLGDVDDRVALTTHCAKGIPFVGRYSTGGGNSTNIESTLAEVVWWVSLDANGRRNLYRRVLLIRPDLNDSSGVIPGAGGDLATYQQMNDVSVYMAYDSAGNPKGIAANSLGSLAKRENRFAHDRSAFPYPLSPSSLVANTLKDERAGEEIVLTDIFGFDVRAYDPLAPVYEISSAPNVAIAPSDPGYNPTAAYQVVTNSTPTPAQPQYANDSAASFVGPWTANTPGVPGYLSDIHSIPAGSGSNSATWSFSSLSNGDYKVWVTWNPVSNTSRASNAPFRVWDGGALAGGPYLLDQRSGPNADVADAGMNWAYLGTVSISSGTLSVRLTDDANGNVVADGVRIQAVPSGSVSGSIGRGAFVDLGYGPGIGSSTSTTVSTSVTILRNDTDAAYVGSWTSATPGTPGYLSDIHSIVAGSGANSATWSFGSLSSGQYKVWVTWNPVNNSSRASNSPFTVYDDTTPLGAAVPLDQRSGPAPADVTDGGMNWLLLGTYNIASGTLRVRVTDAANGNVIADGVRIQGVPAGGSSTVTYFKPLSHFSDNPRAKSKLTVPTFDTWYPGYEWDGKDQDGDGVIDNTTVNAASVSDAPTAKETSPPYTNALRGVEVRIRIYEPDSRQLRQVSVVSNLGST